MDADTINVPLTFKEITLLRLLINSRFDLLPDAKARVKDYISNHDTQVGMKLMMAMEQLKNRQSH